MPGTIDARLEELRVVLPSTTKPVANFVPCMQTGNLLFVSGQIPTWNGELRYVGRVGAEVSVDVRGPRRACAPSTCWRKQEISWGHSIG